MGDDENRKCHNYLHNLFQLIKNDIYAGDKIKQVENNSGFKLRLIIGIILHRNEKANRSPHSRKTILMKQPKSSNKRIHS